MSVDFEKLNALVTVDKIAAQGFVAPLPLSVEVQPKVDHTGDEALQVVMLFPEETPDSVFSKGQVSSIKSWVRDILYQATDFVLFPYISVQRENELAV